MPNQIFILLILIGISTAACDRDSCKDFQWGYEDEESPSHWGTCYAECNGTAQSPLDIRDAIPDASLTALELHYEEVPIDVTNNGHTIEFEYEPGSILSHDNLQYTLLQFHFHTGSEHAVDGQHYPMEVHLVHKHNASDQLTVIGIFFEEGDENAFLKTFSDNLPATKDGFFTSSISVNAVDLFPADAGYYTYSGSLTTPPCSEIVNWFVMKTPVQASALQIQQFRSILHNNNRPLQLPNGRPIKDF